MKKEIHDPTSEAYFGNFENISLEEKYKLCCKVLKFLNQEMDRRDPSYFNDDKKNEVVRKIHDILQENQMPSPWGLLAEIYDVFDRLNTMIYWHNEKT